MIMGDAVFSNLFSFLAWYLINPQRGARLKVHWLSEESQGSRFWPSCFCTLFFVLPKIFELFDWASPDEDYSRKVLCTLNLISTFLLHNVNSFTDQFDTTTQNPPSPINYDVSGKMLSDRPFNLKGGLWFFVSFRIFFSDNTRGRIFFSRIPY